MKKFFYLLMLALPCFMLSACGDDDVVGDVSGGTPGTPSVSEKEAVLLSDGRLSDGSLIYEITTEASEVAVVECVASGRINVDIPNSIKCSGTSYKVTSIKNKAFYDCHDLKSITIGNSVTSIGDEAFYFCMFLTSVTIPNSVESIGDWAFYRCFLLTNVIVGSSVTSIGDRAFSECHHLTDVTCLAKNPPTIVNSFTRCDDPDALHVLPGCKAAYEASGWKKSFRNIVEDANE
ncbi:MAG: leucine-rich repeat domain-containing protein [Bacteroidaceae bacterium]|nr:leucine-rich repeat domain-containing protein [Candidatus Equimonas faecalis]MCQ2206026.1 leucine-rich repeat domain-containing protein [Bacteroidaceae bacterium]